MFYMCLLKGLVHDSKVFVLDVKPNIKPNAIQGLKEIKLKRNFFQVSSFNFVIPFSYYFSVLYKYFEVCSLKGKNRKMRICEG